MSIRLAKEILAWMLAVAVAFTMIPLMNVNVHAASKPALSKSNITVAAGMKYNLKIKNAPKKSSVTWKSNDSSVATVTKKGIVKGKKDGTATIKCVVSKSGKKTELTSNVIVKTPAFAEEKCSLGIDSTAKLEIINKYSGSKYKWSSSKKSVAKVSTKGKVTGVKEGKATIKVEISIPKKGDRQALKIRKSIPVYVTSSAEVSDQKSLEAALKNKKIDEAVIKTEEKVNLEIPEGDYSGKSLVVDAPNADIVNYGVFKTVTIKRIATDTWNEKAKGNVLVLDASAGNIVISKDADIQEVRIVNADSKFTLKVEGSVGKVTIDSYSKVDLKVTGKVGSVEVNDRATVSIDGKGSSIPVTVSENADGTTLNSNVPLDVTSKADTEITLSRGAEGSKIQTENENKSVEVTNNTNSTVIVKNEDGKSQNVGSGENKTIDGKGNITGSTTEEEPAAGGGGGGGGTPSGDLTRYVTAFKGINAVEAGTCGEILKTVDQLTALFPATVTGIADDETVTYQVTSWTNTNNYNPETATAGYYVFTAVLGEGSAKTTIKEGAKATVKAWVKPVGDDIEYTNEENVDFNKFSIKSYQQAGSDLVVELQYSGERMTRVSVKAGIIDSEGDMVAKIDDQGWWRKYVSPGETRWCIFNLNEGEEDEGTALEYTHFKLMISTSDPGEQYKSVKSDVQVVEPTTIERYGGEEDYKCYYATVTFKYSGTAQLVDGDAVVFWKRGNEIIKVYNADIPDMVKGDSYSECMELCWDSDSQEDVKEDPSPDSVSVILNSAVSKDEAQYTGETGKIITEDEALADKFSLERHEKNNRFLIANVKYSGDNRRSVDITAKFYDKDGNYISESKTGYYSYYMEKGETVKFLFDAPASRKGKALEYEKFTLSISSVVIWKDSTRLTDQDVVVGAPADITYDYEEDWANSSVTITNKKSMEVWTGSALVCWWKDDKLLGWGRISLGGLLGNEVYTEPLYYDFYSEDQDQLVPPDRVTVELEYAYATGTVEETFSGPNGTISYTSDNQNYNKFELDSTKKAGDDLLVKLKYNGKKYACSYVTVKYYDASGNFIKSESASGGQMHNDPSSTAGYLFDLPRGLSGKQIDYKYFQLFIEAYPSSNISVKSDLSAELTGGIERYNEEDADACGYYSACVDIKNTGNTSIDGCRAIVYWMKGTDVVGACFMYLDGMAGKSSKKYGVRLSWGEGEDIENDPGVDGIIVAINYAYIYPENYQYTGQSGAISYEGDNEDVNNFELVDNQVIGDTLAVKLKYNGTVFAKSEVFATFYDDNGYFMQKQSVSQYNDPGVTNTYLFELPQESTTNHIFSLSIDAQSEESQYISARENVEIETPQQISESETGTGGKYSAEIVVSNRGKQMIEECGMVVTWWNGNEAIAVDDLFFGSIASSQGSGRTVELSWDSTEGENDPAPDTITAELNYAYSEKSDSNYSGETGAIKYKGSSEEFQKFKLISSSVINDKLAVDLKYTGTSFSLAQIRANFYDSDGALIQQRYEYEYFEHGEINTVLFDLPRGTSGEIITGDKFNLSITADSTGMKSIKDDIDTGTPSAVKVENNKASTSVEVTNNSEVRLEEARYIAFWKKGDTIIAATEEFIGGLEAQEKEALDFNLYYGDIGVSPDSVTVKLIHAIGRDQE